MKKLSLVDPMMAQIVISEEDRQRSTINLIASENYTDHSVMEAVGSVLTDKYAEGYPGKRYYGGCEFVDIAEKLAIERCQELFDAEHVNVQPHSGSQANMAVFSAVLNPGDTILGMGLSEGGHLTHGHPLNFSGKLYKCVGYGVDRETEHINYHDVEELAFKHKPKLIIAGASAYTRFIDYARFAHIAHQVGAYFMVDMAHVAGLVAARVHPNPVPFADFVTSTTHKTLRGPRGGLILCKETFAQQIDKSVMPGIQGGPFINSIAGKAVAFKLAATPEFVDYQQQVICNAQALARALQDMDYRLVSGGTDNHMLVVDLRSKKITGREAETLLAKAGIWINRNTIPYDTEKPLITSGMRLGTPAVTSRGMVEKDMIEIAHLINEVLEFKDERTIIMVAKKVHDMSRTFPLRDVHIPGLRDQSRLKSQVIE